MINYYAVACGLNPGIYNNWNECKIQVKGYKGAKYKKFTIYEEAAQYIQENGINPPEENKEVYIPDYYVYTDGSCSSNGYKNASAGIGIYFGENDIRNVSRKIDGKQTNNVAELTAIYEVYDIIKEDIKKGKKIVIVSDSEYSIRCLTSYGDKCHKDGWNKEIPNKELVMKTYKLYKDIENISFQYCKAHTNKKDIHSIGNYNADKLANNAVVLLNK